MTVILNKPNKKIFKLSKMKNKKFKLKISFKKVIFNQVLMKKNFYLIIVGIKTIHQKNNLIHFKSHQKLIKKHRVLNLLQNKK